MTKNNTVKKHIPNNILSFCAQEAFEATQKHYNEYAGTRLYNYPDNVQRSVERDVRSVLIGNRGAEDLHKAWAKRKVKAFGYNLEAVRKKAPTALLSFKYLTDDDQEGYGIFVDTVWNTYGEMHETVPEQPGVFVHIPQMVGVNYRSGHALRSAADKSLSSAVFEGESEGVFGKGSKASVTVYFESKEDALEFFRAI